MGENDRRSGSVTILACLVGSAVASIAITALTNPFVLPTIFNPSELGLYFERAALLVAVPVSFLMAYPFAAWWARRSTGTWWSALIAGLTYALVWSIALAAINPEPDDNRLSTAFIYFIFCGAWLGFFGSVSFWFILRTWQRSPR